MGRAISVFDEDSSEEQQLKLYPSDPDIPAHADQQGVGIKLDQMSIHHSRRWGDCWLALTLWDQQELDTFWKPRLCVSREGEGNYLLRTNQQKVDPATLWGQYMQLVQIEAVFRTLESDLGLRPIWHQLEHRIEAHIFISFQAYCLQVTLPQRLKALAPGLSPVQFLRKCSGCKW